MMHKIKICAITLLSATILLPPAPAGAQAGAPLQISPPIHTLNLQPGSKQTIAIEVENRSTSSTQVSVSFDDFEPSPDGAPKLLLDGKKNAKYGLSGWLTGQSSFNLTPNQKYKYSAELTVPATAAKQTQFGVIRFKNTVPGESVSLTSAVGSVVLANIGTPVTKGSIAGFEMTEDSVVNTGTARSNFVLTVKNDGPHMFEPKLTVNIIDNQNKIVASIKPDKSGNVLPGSSREYKFTWERDIDPKKTYKAVASAELPDGTKISGPNTSVDIIKPSGSEPAPKDDTQFTASSAANDNTPWVPIIAGAAVLGLAALTVALLIRRKKKNANFPATSFQPNQTFPPQTTVPPANETKKPSDGQ